MDNDTKDNLEILAKKANFDVLASIWKDIHEIKQKIDKENLIKTGIVFFAGVIIGMNSMTWKPFIADGYNFFSSVKNATSIAKGQ